MKELARNVFGVKLSDSHGTDWRTVAICDSCIKGIEPPTLVKKEILAGVRRCDWCGILNAMGKSEDLTETIEAQDKLEQWKIDAFNEGLGTSIFAAGMRKVERVEDEDLPVDCVMLDVAYSPVIPISGGELSEAVEVEKLNDFTYRFEYRHQLHTVSADKIREMRARYIVTHNEAAKKFMRENNPVGHIFHTIGSYGLPENKKKNK